MSGKLRVYRKGKKTDKVITIEKAQMPLNDRQKLQVKRLVTKRSELKYHSKQFNAQNFGSGTNQYLIDLTDVPQGVTDTTRIGDKSTLSKIEYTFTLFSGSPTSQHVVRVLFFQYKPNDAATLPNIDTIVDAGPTTVVDPWSPYDHDFKSDYTILSDRIYTLNPNQSSWVSVGLRVLSTKRANKEITYTAGATFGGHHIYMAVFSNAGTASLTGRTRMYFRDS